jgi:hypothetical protein
MRAGAKRAVDLERDVALLTILQERLAIQLGLPSLDRAVFDA